MKSVTAYQHGIFPRSEAVVAATRGLERGRNSPQEVDAAFRQDVDAFVALQRAAGLDLYSDGLLRWQDIFRPLVGACEGLEARTLVRWFDNNTFYRAPEGDGPITFTGLPPVYEDLEAVPAPRVATLPSPLLFARASKTSAGRGDLMVELSREVLRPAVAALAQRGCRVIHLQEPSLVYFGIEPESWSDFEKAIAEVRDAAGSNHVQLILHTYFGDAAPYADRLRSLPVDAVGIDLVETDPASLGSRWEMGLLAGALDGRSSIVEPLEQTVSFLSRVADAVEPSSLFVSSNSELEFLPTDVAAAKVRRLGQVAAELKKVVA